MDMKTIYVEVNIAYHDLEPLIDSVVFHENLPKGTPYKPIRGVFQTDMKVLKTLYDQYR